MPSDSFLEPSTRGLCMIHSVAVETVYLFPPQVRYLGIPPCTWTCWTLCYAGFPHSQWSQTEIITLTNGHQNHRDQILSPDSLMGIFFFPHHYYSYTFFFLYIFLSVIFTFLYCFCSIDNNQNGYKPPSHCNQIVL